MWCPEGYVTWHSQFEDFHRIADEILALVSGKPEVADGQTRGAYSSAHYMMEAGFAKNYAEASLLVALTATWLMANFVEDYPPLAVSIDGRELNLSWVFFAHRDHLEHCPFAWPMQENSYFTPFFRNGPARGLRPDDLYYRFPFINTETGMLTTKHGAEDFLRNGVGLSDESVEQALTVASASRGMLVCWRGDLDQHELRDFCSSLEVSDAFSTAVDRVLGQGQDTTWGDSGAIDSKRLGRPRKVDDARTAIIECFPSGILGTSHKEVRRAIELRTGLQFSERTVSRAMKFGQK